MGEPAPPDGRIAAIVDSSWFGWTIMSVIVANAVVLGLSTYSSIDREYGDTLFLLNEIFFGIFVAELVLRIAAYGRRPWDFFRSGWNVFDFVVIGMVFVPGVRENATLLRMARLLRIVRIIRLLPDVRVMLRAVGHSLPPLFSVGVLTGLVLFAYGMVGWLIFGEEDPARWGDIGAAMLTLFVLLTLENFPVLLQAGMEIHEWSWIYFVSFVLIAAFIVLNVLIGIVLNSMEEAREIERRQSLAERGTRAVGADAGIPTSAHVAERIRILRAALDELERDLADPDAGRR